MSDRSRNDPLEVLLVGPTPPPHGGVAVHLANLRKSLREGGVPCECLDPSSGDGSPLARMIDTARAIRRTARGEGLIHVHTNGHNSRSWLLALLSAVAGTRARGRVLTLHSGILPDYLDEGPSWRGRLARLTCRRFDRVVAVNDRILDSLVAVGVERDRVDVVPAWTGSVEPDNELPAEIRQWLARHEPVVGTVLAFRPEYRFGWQLGALIALRSRHPDAGLIVVGGGEEADAARRRIHELGLDDNVLLLGDVPHARCLGILSRCDVSLRTTSHDGDALSVREALALDVPVVASDVGARPEGTRVFPADDFRALLQQLRLALAAPRVRRQETPAISGASEPDGIARTASERLLDVYRAVTGSDLSGREPAPVVAGHTLSRADTAAAGHPGLVRGGHR